MLSGAIHQSSRVAIEALEQRLPFDATPLALAIGLYNTGVDDDGRPLPDGRVDTHYDAYTVNGDAWMLRLGFWSANTDLARWIGPAAVQGPEIEKTCFRGKFNYWTTFDLSDVEPHQLQITGRWLADNDGIQIIVNGHPLTTTGVAHDNDPAQFTIDPAVLVRGQNTVMFRVLSDDTPQGNAAGMQVMWDVRGVNDSPPPPVHQEPPVIKASAVTAARRARPSAWKQLLHGYGQQLAVLSWLAAIVLMVMGFQAWWRQRRAKITGE